jgi:hypothetical protein
MESILVDASEKAKESVLESEDKEKFRFITPQIFYQNRDEQLNNITKLIQNQIVMLKYEFTI